MAHALYNHLILISHCPLPCLFQLQGKRQNYRNLCALATTRQNWVSASGTKLWAVVYTQAGRGGGWCHLASLRNKPRERLSRRRAFCPPSHRAWCGDVTVQWKKEVIFFPFDYSLGKPGFLFFFSLYPFQSLLEKVIIICGSCIHSIPCGKDSVRWSAPITWGLSFNIVKIWSSAL